MFTPAEIAASRKHLEQTLPDSAVIQTRQHASDQGGGVTSSWANAGTVACRVEPVAGPEGEPGGRISPEADWLVTLPAGTSVALEGRIVTGGRTFEVLEVRAPRTWELAREVEVRESV